MAVNREWLRLTPEFGEVVVESVVRILCRANIVACAEHDFLIQNSVIVERADFYFARKIMDEVLVARSNIRVFLGSSTLTVRMAQGASSAPGRGEAGVL